MDGFSKLSRDAQIVLVGGVVLLIISFFDWQQFPVSLGYLGTPGANEWHGIGILAGLLVVAMLVWEVLRLMAVNVTIGTLSPALVSLGLALLTALFTVIAFFSKSLLRHWPAWVGLIAAVVVGVAAVSRARAEGVQMPQGMQTGSTAPPAPAESAAPAGHVESAEPREDTTE